MPLLIAFIVCLILNLADFGATAVLIARSGFSIEATPWLHSWVVSANSVWPILVAKLIPVATLGFCLVYYHSKLQHRFKIITNVLWGVNIILALVVLWSVMLIYGVFTF